MLDSRYPTKVQNSPRQMALRAAAYFLAWTFLGLFFSSREILRRTYYNEPFIWQNVLTTWLVGEWIWGVVALVVLAIGNRWPLERPALGRHLALHAVLSVAVASAQLALEATAYKELGTLSPALSQSFWRAWPALLVIALHTNVVLYWVILALQTGYRLYQRLQERDRQALQLELHASELRTQLMHAQLNALKMQLQPHFLFNTLNAIMVLVREQSAARAEEMLARLSDLLRCVLDDSDAQEVPLRRELEYVRLYLSIEEVRFEDRLTVTVCGGRRRARCDRSPYVAAADRRERPPPRHQSHVSRGDHSHQRIARTGHGRHPRERQRAGTSGIEWIRGVGHRPREHASAAGHAVWRRGHAHHRERRPWHGRDDDTALPASAGRVEHPDE